MAAGLEQWLKLWQNLRSTRKTELCASFPIHVVCEWIGNSEAVAKQHYLQVTEDHMARAAVQSGSPSVDTDLCRPPIPPHTNTLQRAAIALQSGQKPTEIVRNEETAAQDSYPLKNPGKRGKEAVFPGFLNAESGDSGWALRDSNQIARTQARRSQRPLLAPLAAPLRRIAN